MNRIYFIITLGVMLAFLPGCTQAPTDSGSSTATPLASPSTAEGASQADGLPRLDPIATDDGKGHEPYDLKKGIVVYRISYAAKQKVRTELRKQEGDKDKLATYLHSASTSGSNTLGGHSPDMSVPAAVGLEKVKEDGKYFVSSEHSDGEVKVEIFQPQGADPLKTPIKLAGSGVYFTPPLALEPGSLTFKVENKIRETLRLELYDSAGEEVKGWEIQEAGPGEFQVDIKDAGNYFLLVKEGADWEINVE